MITDAEIRGLYRADPSLLDTLMVAIHSRDAELRRLARAHFVNLQRKANTR